MQACGEEDSNTHSESRHYTEVITIIIIIIIIIIITAIKLLLGGSSPYSSTEKTNKNKYT